jgi:large subunit ribosomal protein L23
MAFKDIFKKKNKEEKKDLKFGINKEVNTINKEKDKKEKKEKHIKEKKQGVHALIAPFILKEPHITEKATDLTNYNQYIFRVYKNANKIQVKKAVEEIYNVDVVNVRIINTKEKKIRLGRFEGTKPGFKKAIVKLKEGQKIEIFPR